MTSPDTLTSWLRDRAARDALLSAWAPDGLSGGGPRGDALVVAALGAKAMVPVTILTPSGRGPLPLLAAAHSAMLRLGSFPSPFSLNAVGPAALVTQHTIRREELGRLHAAGVLVSAALSPARLRADTLVATLPTGRVRAQHATDLLLVVHPTSGWAMPQLPPTTAVIDAVDAPEAFLADALAWAERCGATTVVFADAARRGDPIGVVYPAGWSVLAREPDGDALTDLARVRGHAAVLDAASVPGLGPAAVLLADARRRRLSWPDHLVQAAVAWRRLDELVVPIADYDAACPRWHSPTLSERLADLAKVSAADFPRGWAGWAQTCWAPIKYGLAEAHAALAGHNAKAQLLIEAVDSEIRAGRPVDVALPSRVARDAVTKHLAAAGLAIAQDGQLLVRSLGDPNEWGPPRATLLVAPPGRAHQHRLVGADVGALNVLCYDHERAALRRVLEVALNEPGPSGPLRALLPPNLVVSLEAATLVPVVLTVEPVVADRVAPRHATALARLADCVDLSGLAALSEPAAVADSGEPAELPDFDDEFASERAAGEACIRAAVSLTVERATEPEAGLFVVLVPADAALHRLVGLALRRVVAVDVMPGMLLSGLDGTSPFERLRPLLIESRGPVARIMLAAWEQALTVALDRAGGAAELARALRRAGGDVAADSVAHWTDDDRIGPRDPANIARVGQLAGHQVVAGSAAAIADIMRGLRTLHQAVGRAVAVPGGPDPETVAQLESLLGPDAVAITAEAVLYRIVAVGNVVEIPNRDANRLRPVTATSRPDALAGSARRSKETE